MEQTKTEVESETIEILSTNESIHDNQYNGNNNSSIDDDESSLQIIQQTIQKMETSGGLLCDTHINHQHSFSAVSFLISGSMRTCAGCGKRLPSVFGVSSNNTNQQVVRCCACLCYSHRKCSFEPSLWREPCPVNANLSTIGSDSASSTFLRPAMNTVAKIECRKQTSKQTSQDNHINSSIISEESISEAASPSSGTTDKSTEPQRSLPILPMTDNMSSLSQLSSADGKTPVKSFFQMLSPKQQSNNVPSAILGTRSSPSSPLANHDENDEEGEVRQLEEEEDDVTTATTATSMISVPLSSMHYQKSSSLGDDSAMTTDDNTSSTSNEMIWTSDGPPKHWASSEEKLEGVHPALQPGVVIIEEEKVKEENSATNDNKGNDNETDNSTDNRITEDHQCHDKGPINHTKHPFASVSRVLQENVIKHFAPKQKNHQSDKSHKDSVDYSIDGYSENSSKSSNDEQDPGNNDNGNIPTGKEKETVDDELNRLRKEEEEDTLIQYDINCDSVESPSLIRKVSNEKESVKALLTEVNKPPPPTATEQTLDIVKKSMKLPIEMKRKAGWAAVAGGIAGGAAGLVFAGPAGFLVGAKCGQAAGLLGVILEGSVGVGVIVAGVAAGSFGADHVQKARENKRVLTLGDDSDEDDDNTHKSSGSTTRRKVMLVRPNIVVDPIWDNLCAKAIRQSPTNKSPHKFGVIPNPIAKRVERAKVERQKRDSDIIETDEYEIPTEDKVLLLVSRSLNDKLSLPGHVYRCLIEDYRDRCTQRDKEKVEQGAASGTPSAQQKKNEKDSKVYETKQGDLTKQTEAEKTPTCTESPQEVVSLHSQCRRQDVHGVIKHVTATLLEVRPGFASSRAITEMSATAVEGLVFGELYDSVMEEIIEETSDADSALTQKILAFEEQQRLYGGRDWCDTGIYDSALKALHMLPSAHSAVDKLRHCVEFLMVLSQQFSGVVDDPSRSANTSNSGKVVSADSLLKMVCQHFIVAKVNRINAEIMFLEEFARDEQLLRGKEGYALVTMQASLHFLNASEDFQTDIFGQEDEG